MKAANKQWVHPPDTLLRGHIVYNVKFLGETEVETPKGTDVVKEAIRKRKFNKHIKKAEGQKPPKVELTISADGVTVQDPKTKIIMHQYALHRISYCADDKSDKRMFTFIAKAGDCDKHFCYVFDSEKCAEEITLTIGQAFDLAYRRFLETSSRDFDLKKQYLVLQKKVQSLEKENLTLKIRIQELERQQITGENNHNLQISQTAEEDVTNDSFVNSSSIFNLDSPASLKEESSTDDPVYSEIQPKKQTSVGRRLENLMFEPHTNGTSDLNKSVTSNGSTTPGILSPPPPSSRSRTHSSNSTPMSPSSQPPLATPTTPSSSQAGLVDPFGATPFGNVNPVTQQSVPVDPFGMASFNPNSSQDIDKAIQNMDKELLDLQTGFSQGLSFGSEDFSLADLDPLSQK